MLPVVNFVFVPTNSKHSTAHQPQSCHHTPTPLFKTTSAFQMHFKRVQTQQDGSGSTALRLANDGNAKTRVRFWLKFHVDYGQTIRVIGGSEALGE